MVILSVVEYRGKQAFSKMLVEVLYGKAYLESSWTKSFNNDTVSDVFNR